MTAVPMTRKFIESLVNSSSGSMWSNLWKTFPYDDCAMPDRFHDKKFDPEEADEVFDLYHPLIVRDGDVVSIPKFGEKYREALVDDFIMSGGLDS